MKCISIAVFLSFWVGVASWALEVQGHRGARWVRPENTLPAFQYAIENGVDTLELDLHVTKDNQLVITHDPFLNPAYCTDSKGNRVGGQILVRSLTLEQLQTYDCGGTVNPKFPEQKIFPHTRVPTLEALFKWVEASPLPQARKVRFNIETKSEAAHPEYTPTPEEFVPLILDLIKRHGFLGRVILQSFDYRTLKIAHQLQPSLTLSVLVESRPTDVVRLIKENQAQILSPDFTWLTAKDVQDLHGAGVKVLPWTVNQPADWAKMVQLGVDGIITDNPRALIDFLKTVPEKLPAVR